MGAEQFLDVSIKLGQPILRQQVLVKYVGNLSFSALPSDQHTFADRLTPVFPGRTAIMAARDRNYRSTTASTTHDTGQQRFGPRVSAGAAAHGWCGKAALCCLPKLIRDGP